MPEPETVPLPATLTVSVRFAAANDVLTFLFEFILSVHVVADFANAQSPPQPVKSASLLGVTVKVTVAMLVTEKTAAQSEGHLMPGPVTVPLGDGDCGTVTRRQ